MTGESRSSRVKDLCQDTDQPLSPRLSLSFRDADCITERNNLPQTKFGRKSSDTLKAFAREAARCDLPQASLGGGG
ncbi:hypothetical protein Q31b_32310 [Novipirellula aureliae]|uniref:Uncharacterized protein n=1 Tax=Novipirellula aureliae TaxID=2527966 RepID=A0A5C6DUD9_9BACT|nr:hypothetical protein Q31b_32310 [Novipirellula aureliae]